MAENLENVYVTWIKTAPTLKIHVFYNVTPCNLVAVCQCFRRTRYLHRPRILIYHDGRRFKILRNATYLLRDCMTSHTTIQSTIVQRVFVVFCLPIHVNAVLSGIGLEILSKNVDTFYKLYFCIDILCSSVGLFLILSLHLSRWKPFRLDPSVARYDTPPEH